MTLNRSPGVRRPPFKTIDDHRSSSTRRRRRRARTSLVGGRRARDGFQLRLAGVRSNLAAGLRLALDEQSAAVVGQVAADRAAVNELCLFPDEDVALDLAVDVAAPAVLDDQVPVDGAAE